MHENQHWHKRKKKQTHNLVHDHTESIYYILDKILEISQKMHRDQILIQCVVLIK